MRRIPGFADFVGVLMGICLPLAVPGLVVLAVVGADHGSPLKSISQGPYAGGNLPYRLARCSMIGTHALSCARGIVGLVLAVVGADHGERRGVFMVGGV